MSKGAAQARHPPTTMSQITGMQLLSHISACLAEDEAVQARDDDADADEPPQPHLVTEFCYLHGLPVPLTAAHAWMDADPRFPVEVAVPGRRTEAASRRSRSGVAATPRRRRGWFVGRSRAPRGRSASPRSTRPEPAETAATVLDAIRLPLRFRPACGPGWDHTGDDHKRRVRRAGARGQTSGSPGVRPTTGGGQGRRRLGHAPLPQRRAGPAAAAAAVVRARAQRGGRQERRVRHRRRHAARSEATEEAPAAEEDRRADRRAAKGRGAGGRARAARIFRRRAAVDSRWRRVAAPPRLGRR